MTSNPPPPPGANGPYTALPSAAASAGGGIMPSAGHFADMQTLMSNLDNLSGWLQQNREDFEGLRDGLRRVEGMGGRAGQTQLPLENGDTTEESQSAQTIANLRKKLEDSNQRNANLQDTLGSFQKLHDLFNTTLTDTMRLIRNYTYSQQAYIGDLHRHYTKLLQDARYETLEAQLTHQKWQEALMRASDTCREAVKSRDKELDYGGMRAEVKGLKLENRLLRRKVGWEIRPDSDEEVEEDPGEEEGALGRGSRGNLGLSLAAADTVIT